MGHDGIRGLQGLNHSACSLGSTRDIAFSHFRGWNSVFLTGKGSISVVETLGEDDIRTGGEEEPGPMQRRAGLRHRLFLGVKLPH